MYIKNGVLHVRRSEVMDIAVMSDNRKGRKVTHNSPVTWVQIPLAGTEKFVLVVLTDRNGKHAVSQPYFL